MNIPRLSAVLLLCFSLCIGFPKMLLAAEKSDSIMQDCYTIFFLQPTLLSQWKQVNNPAGLHLLPMDALSRIQSGFNHAQLNIKRAADPGMTNGLNIETESIQTLGRAKVHGLFGYQNHHYRDLLYNGNMDFSHTNLYTMGDTIGGPQRQEGYYFNATLSVPFFADRLVTGLQAEYEAATGAKMRDLRNKNDITKLKLNPGLVFQLNRISIGLNGGPIWESNYTTVSSVLDEKHNYFFFKGFGHFIATRNMTGTETRRYETNGYHGALQLQFKQNNLQLINQVSYEHLETQSLHGSSFRLLDGITDVNRIQYTGELQLETKSHFHQLGLQAHSSSLIGTEIQQETRSRHEEGLWLYYVHTLRWIDDRHIANELHGELTYTLSAKGSADRPLRYQLTAAATIQENKAGHYPIQNYGSYDASTASARIEYRHFFKLNKIQFNPLIGVKTRFNLSENLTLVPYDNFFETIPTTDFRYFKEDYYMGTLHLSFLSSAIPFLKQSRVSLDIESSYAVFPNVDMDENDNLYLRFSLGVVF